MAQESGFFEATWDDELINPDTGTAGDYDIKYYAYQFADYFKNFIGNGVFASPVNQLKVSAGTNLQILIEAGWAFINGFWYHNTEQMQITVPTNGTSVSRTDMVVVRYSEVNKTITIQYVTGDVTPIRSDLIYDLKLAEVVVPATSTQILNSNITDTRSDENVCGFVKGLVEVVNTNDLFEQYQAIFDEWFDDIKDQLTGDLAVRLQLEFNEIEQGFEEDKELIEDYVYNDYVKPVQTLVFTNKVCEITDAKVKSTSLIDVYFTSETIENAEDAKISVDSQNGKIVLNAEVQPSGTIQAAIRVRV